MCNFQSMSSEIKRVLIRESVFFPKPQQIHRPMSVLKSRADLSGEEKQWKYSRE